MRLKRISFITVFLATAIAAHAQTTWFVATTGSDSNACTAASPCRSINRPYQIAAAGDTIQVAAGAYGAQTITFRAGMVAPGITVQPSAGATPTFTDVSIRGSHLTIRGPMIMRTLDLGDPSFANRTQHVTIDGVTVDHQNSATPDHRTMKVWATDNVTLKNSVVGNTRAGTTVGNDSNLIQFSGATFSTNFTIDNVRFHHNDTPKPSGAHNECIYAINIQGFTVRNSRFESCTYYGIFFTDFLNGQPSLKDVTIENNTFATGQNDSGANFVYSIDLHANVRPNNFKFRYNTFENWVAFSFGGPVTNGFEVKGNIFGLGVVADWTVGTFACKSGVTFSFNVMPQACGSNAKVASASAIRSGWVSPNATWGVVDDFHLISTSPAVNAGDPNNHPGTDIEGNPRPAGSADAGAHQFGATASRPEPPTGVNAVVR